MSLNPEGIEKATYLRGFFFSLDNPRFRVHLRMD